MFRQRDIKLVKVRGLNAAKRCFCLVFGLIDLVVPCFERVPFCMCYAKAGGGGIQ